MFIRKKREKLVLSNADEQYKLIRYIIRTERRKISLRKYSYYEFGCGFKVDRMDFRVLIETKKFIRLYESDFIDKDSVDFYISDFSPVIKFNIFGNEYYNLVSQRKRICSEGLDYIELYIVPDVILRILRNRMYV